MRLIPVCSGKGGTGKSCVAAYTASALASMKKRVLLIDAGDAPGSLDIILGVQDAAVFNLSDVLVGACDVEKAVLPIPKQPNLRLLPAGIVPAGIASAKASAKMSLTELLRSIRYDYDYVFIDSADYNAFDVKMATSVLLVTTPDTLSVRTASQKSRELYDAGAKNLRLVINNVPARVLPMKSFRDFDEIIDQTAARLIAVIPASQRLSYAANNGLPISPESLTLQVFERLASRLRGKSEPLLIR